MWVDASMVTEFDLPCTECGGEIVRTELSPGNGSESNSSIRYVGECTECNARFYPAETLESLSDERG